MGRRTVRDAALAALTAAAFVGAAVAFSPPALGDAAPAKAARARKRPPLTVKKITPRHGARFVSLLAQVRVVFSAPIDATTVDAGSIVFRRLLGDPVDAAFDVSANGKTLTVTPREPMQPGSDYELIVRRTVARADGSPLKREARTIFYTDNRFARPQWVRPEQFTEVEDLMHEGRAAHTATRMSNGTVLLAGGEVDNVGTLAVTGEEFSPQSQTFTLATTYLVRRRSYHQAAAFQNGAVLLGGWDGVTATSSVETYDPVSNAFRAAEPMTEPRDFHAATRLQDGRVLVTGGLQYVAGGVSYSSTAEILGLDGTWRPTLSAPITRRAGHTLTLLEDGSVFVVGGTTTGSQTAEVFDPVAETFRLVKDAPRAHRQLHTATAVDGGKRVVCADGGNPIVEVYDLETDRFYAAAGSSFLNRTRATASTLPDGNILIAGGIESRGTEMILLQSMDVYVRSAGAYGSVYYVPVIFREARAAHTATNLLDGRILFAGGFGIEGASLNSSVLWTPDPVTPGKR